MIHFETYADCILVGGMSYDLDPGLKAPPKEKGKSKKGEHPE